MTTAHNIYLINYFPDFNAPGFDIERYNSLFIENNVIINAQSSDVEYDDHWGALSLKCAFNGREFYRTKDHTVAVDDSSFLIFNEGKIYSSYIKSESKVESLTINFRPAFVNEVLNSSISSHAAMLDQCDGAHDRTLHFYEKLYPHNPVITPLLLRLRKLSLMLNVNKHRIAETFYQVLEQLICSQDEVRRQIELMTPIRNSTKQELFKRLHNAKDYIDSCFTNDLSLDQIAHIAHLAPSYFLREFKKNFHITPHQYLTERRLKEAKYLLLFSNKSTTEICMSVGFSDLSSFSKLFKHRFGLSPLNFKKVLS